MREDAEAIRGWRNPEDPGPTATAVQRLGQAASRDEARVALDGLPVAQLKEVAAQLREGGITLPHPTTREKVKTWIVEYAVGRRLDADAISRVGNTGTGRRVPAANRAGRARAGPSAGASRRSRQRQR